MGKMLPNRLKEVVYTLSPFETTVMSGLWKDVPAKLQRKFSEVLKGIRSCLFMSSKSRSGGTIYYANRSHLLQNWTDVTFFFLAPTYATIWYAHIQARRCIVCDMQESILKRTKHLCPL